MPRTKLARKKSSMRKGRTLLGKPSISVESLSSSSSSEVGERSDDVRILLTTNYKSPAQFLNAFEAFFEKKVAAHVKKYEYCQKHSKDLILKMLANYPENYLNTTLYSFYDENLLPQVLVTNEDMTGSKHRSRLQSSSEVPDVFKKPRNPCKTSRKRSLSAPAPAAPQPPTPEFKTPLNSARKQMAMIKTITPKVSNTPVSVMRRPQHGEVAFSTSGSPLLVGAISREDIPTVSVPLQDGRVFSILPDPGLPPPDLPEFDEETKKYLRTLREHLALLSSP